MARVEVKNTATRRTDDTGTRFAGRWFDKSCDGADKEAERAQRVMTAANHLWERHEQLRSMWGICSRNYGDVAGPGMGMRGFRQNATPTRVSKLSLNVSKSVADTYVALVTEDPVKIQFLTSDGAWELQQRAKELEKFVDGIYYDQDLHEKDALYELDVAKYGTAWEFYFEDDSDPKGPRAECRRVMPWCVLLDDTEAQIGKLRTLFLIVYADRADLLEEFEDKPDCAAKIRTASSTVFDLGANNAGMTEVEIQDLVATVYSWHLPRTSESGDGRWVRVLGDVVLEQGEWADLEFPAEPLYRLAPGEGMWGSSLVDELRGIQQAVNTKTRMIDRSDHLLGAGHWLVPNGAHINTNAMDNQIGSIIRHDPGMPPQFVSVQPVAETIYQERDRLVQYAYEIIGLNQMSTTGTVPAGIKSGRAMRTFGDIQQKRFKPAYQQFQGFHLRRTKQILNLARKIGAKFPNYEVKAAGKDTMAAVKWAGANLKESEFTLKLYPTNALADDPAERIEQVTEIQGLPPEMKRLLDFPDLAAEASYENASYELVMKCASRILEQGEKGYQAPEVYMDLPNAIKRMQLVRVKAKLDGVPDDKLRLLQNWIAQAVELKESPEFAAMNPPPPMPPGAMPPGAPPMRPPGAAPLPPMPPGMPAQPMPPMAA
jgi:hypothetical protein